VRHGTIMGRSLLSFLRDLIFRPNSYTKSLLHLSEYSK